MHRSLLTCFFGATMAILPAFAAAAPAPKGVTIVNDENQPVPVYEVINKQPFQWGETVDFDPTQLGGSVSFTVPAGNRLVIEYVSGNAGIDIGDLVAFSVWTTVNRVFTRHEITPTAVGPAGGFAKGYIANQSLVLYADPETVVTVYAGDTLGGRAAMHASISGYLVPIR